MPELNNARLKSFGSYIVVYNYEVVNEEMNIWKGIQYQEPEQRNELLPYVYFSRNYYPDTTDFDKLWPEIVWDDESLIGVPCLLVQKEKLLFGYLPAPEGGIILPKPKTIKFPQ